MYGEGGNHFVHTVRRNPDITHLVHNNMVYGLTKGQASPTSQEGFETPVQTGGVFLRPLNPIALALSLGAGFVARAYCGDPERAAEMVRRAMEYRGYALVDIFQPCVSFNKVNTYKWFEENTYYLESDHDPTDRLGAMRRALEEDRLPLGVFYESPPEPTFGERARPGGAGSPLHEHRVDPDRIREVLESTRR
jgi:2-oxoglutarate ferredoxin oxidoreductase subunit beta